MTGLPVESDETLEEIEDAGYLPEDQVGEDDTVTREQT